MKFPKDLIAGFLGFLGIMTKEQLECDHSYRTSVDVYTCPPAVKQIHKCTKCGHKYVDWGN